MADNEYKFYSLDVSDGDDPVKTLPAAVSKVLHTEAQARAAIEEAENWRVVLSYSSWYENSLYQEEYRHTERELEPDEYNIVTSGGKFAGFLVALEKWENKPCPVEKGNEFGLLLTPEFDRDGNRGKYTTNGNVIGHPVSSNVVLYIKHLDEKQ